MKPLVAPKDLDRIALGLAARRADPAAPVRDGGELRLSELVSAGMPTAVVQAAEDGAEALYRTGQQFLALASIHLGAGVPSSYGPADVQGNPQTAIDHGRDALYRLAEQLEPLANEQLERSQGVAGLDVNERLRIWFPNPSMGRMYVLGAGSTLDFEYVKDRNVAAAEQVATIARNLASYVPEARVHLERMS